jgi:uncharacterized cupredoxin-like copper-binding protein
MSKWTLSLAACAALSLASTGYALASEPTKVLVKLSDGSNGHMSLTLSPSHVPAGPVEFTVKNESGSTVHEFMFAMRAKPGAPLPYDAKTQQVEEDAIKGLQGIEDLRPRETVTAEFTLAKGRYVVFCNEPGHYRGGMRTEFDVGAGQ